MYHSRALLDALADDQRREIVRWHYHPDSHPDPHIHAVGIDGHIPSGRVIFESVVRYMIQELTVEQKRADWDEILATQKHGIANTAPGREDHRLPRSLAVGESSPAILKQEVAVGWRLNACA